MYSIIIIASFATCILLKMGQFLSSGNSSGGGGDGSSSTPPASPPLTLQPKNKGRHEHLHKHHHILEISEARLEKLKVVVVGDVHGCFDELLLLLQKCDFKENRPEEWLAIFVGDIINKGPKNVEVLRYIMSLNNALVVKGNHEHNVLSKGGIKTAGEEGKRELSMEEMSYLQKLPLTIRIPSFKCLIVHAGIIPGIKLEEQDHNDMMNMRNIEIDSKSGKSIALTRPVSGTEHWADVWNAYVRHRSKIVNDVDVDVDDANSLLQSYDLIIYGHDAKRKLQTKPHSIGLDTGCLYGGELTGYLLHSREYVNIQALKPYVKKDSD